MLKSQDIDSRPRRFGYGLILAAIATSTLLVGAALVTPRLAQAATPDIDTTPDMSPVISINIVPQGIYWNGHKVDSVSLQHRSVVAARVNPDIPVLLTAAQDLSDNRIANTTATLRNAGLNDVDLQLIQSGPDPEIAAANNPDPLAQYRVNRRPKYPASAIMNRQEGTVALKVHFAADGTALGAKATAPGVAPVLVKSALAAVLSWRSAAGGSQWLRVPIEYQLHEFKGKPLKELPPLPPGQVWRWSADGKSVRSVPAGSTSS